MKALCVVVQKGIKKQPNDEDFDLSMKKFFRCLFYSTLFLKPVLPILIFEQGKIFFVRAYWC